MELFSRFSAPFYKKRIIIVSIVSPGVVRDAAAWKLRLVKAARNGVQTVPAQLKVMGSITNLSE